MNLKDAISSLQLRKKKVSPNILTTVWGENLDFQHVLDEYPRPQLERDDWINLNGYWGYAFTEDKVCPSKMDGQILVPFSPESKLSGVERSLQPDEYLWYERTFLIKSTQLNTTENRRLLLHFGAVDQKCAVWCNKKYVCSHHGGYLPFSAEISSFLIEGNNTIMVRVQDDTDTSCNSRGKQTLTPGGMFYTAQSGIWQTVWMEWVPDIFIESLRITPLFDESAVRLQFKTNVPVMKQIRVDADGLILYSGSTSMDTIQIALSDLRPWSPESPFLYSLTIEAGTDHIRSYFAMRKFSTNIDTEGIPRLCLNNKPYFQNGVLDQGYWPDGLYTAPSDEALQFDIKAMKALGFNMIRKHIKIEPLRWYYHCDRLGMIVWQDMINGGGRSYLTFLCYLPTALPFVTAHFKDNHYKLFSRSDKKGKQQWLRECRSTIEHLYNCPSVGLWVAFNEGWGQFDAVKVTNYMRSLDSTRPIDHASGWYDQHCGDVKSIHNYFRPLKVDVGSRPFVVSEYGGYICNIKGHSYSEQLYGYSHCENTSALQRKFNETMFSLKQLEKEGLCAAVYTQLSDVEEEANGLYTYDRKICKLQDYI